MANSLCFSPAISFKSSHKPGVVVVGSSAAGKVFKFNNVFQHHGNSKFQSLEVKMNMIKVPNIMGIEPKPFDPKTYVEEDTFVTDESGSKKRIRLENNIVRWRNVKNPDSTTSYESNARFVR